ncbi:hypothetical protein OG458_40770 [Streptomyces sp. NBC_01281]|uniref:hypothetical protein n=1 Tax=unclassified Streptomyces TaxID=2593676 RepID=UPI002E163CDC|nr:hypothetical protein OG458_40770 [Streptomyces sp. NBC_01281]
MPGQPTLPYGHIALPADLLATALYGLGQYEAAQIELRGDGLRPSTSTCSLVTWLWDNGRQREATNVVSTTCAVLRGRPVPGGAGRITHGAVIDAFGAELENLGITPVDGWAAMSEHLYAEVPRGF